MRLLIKNMVCRHCVAAVARVLDTLDIAYRKVEIGSVDLTAPLPPDSLGALDAALAAEEIGRAHV